jgi:hypothetical protein
VVDQKIGKSPVELPVGVPLWKKGPHDSQA